jgi:hypothetical protein
MLPVISVEISEVLVTAVFDGDIGFADLDSLEELQINLTCGFIQIAFAHQ